MSVWRRKALELFPQLGRKNLQETTIYWLFSDLGRLAYKAHEDRDLETLKNIYTFAEWCFRQRAQPLWNSAGVSFYEHLFDRPRYMADVLPYLSDYVIYNVWVLWESRLKEKGMEKLKATMKEQKRRIP